MQIKSSKSRRAFMKQTSVLAGGALALPLLSKANFFSGANDVIRIALIGCGGRGTGAAFQALMSHKNVKLVAMADAFRDRLDGCFNRLTEDDLSDSMGVAGNPIKARIDVPEERKFTGFDAYAKAIPLADVVILATPPGFRPIHFTEAINQNKHVFMEKPVAVDTAGVKLVLEAAEKAKQKKTECSSWFATSLSKFLPRIICP